MFIQTSGYLLVNNSFNSQIDNMTATTNEPTAAIVAINAISISRYSDISHAGKPRANRSTNYFSCNAFPVQIKHLVDHGQLATKSVQRSLIEKTAIKYISRHNTAAEVHAS